MVISKAISPIPTRSPPGISPPAPGARGNEVIVQAGQLNIARSNLLTEEKAEARDVVSLGSAPESIPP